jgi:hypothetical protein
MAAFDFPNSPASGQNYTANNNSWQYNGTYWVPIVVGGPANPTAKVGLTAINGTALTAIRSDGAPALDLNIAPTWSGIHTYPSGLARMTSPRIVTSIADTNGDIVFGIATDKITAVKAIKPEIGATTSTATSITLDSTHSGTVLLVSAAATITLPSAGSVSVGYNVMIIQTGSGLVSFAAGGNTLNSFGSKLKLAGQHASASLVCTATSTFNLSGNLIA